MRVAHVGVALLLAVRGAEAQQSTEAPTVEPAVQAPSPVGEEAVEDAGPEWSFSLSVLAFIAEGSDYVQPTLTIDRGWLHLAARYNYEDLDTASLWVGYNLSFGEELTLDFTPMAGVVFGDTNGVAPGYMVTLGWRGLELYTEGEYVFDSDDSSENFFYSWSEFTYSPTEWLRAGVVAERTKIRDENSEIDIGPMIGLTYERLDFSAYLLFPQEGDPTVAIGVGIEF